MKILTILLGLILATNAMADKVNNTIDLAVQELADNSLSGNLREQRYWQMFESSRVPIQSFRAPGEDISPVSFTVEKGCYQGVMVQDESRLNSASNRTAKVSELCFAYSDLEPGIQVQFTTGFGISSAIYAEYNVAEDPAVKTLRGLEMSGRYKRELRFVCDTSDPQCLGAIVVSKDIYEPNACKLAGVEGLCAIGYYKFKNRIQLDPK